MPSKPNVAIIYRGPANVGAEEFAAMLASAAWDAGASVRLRHLADDSFAPVDAIEDMPALAGEDLEWFDVACVVS